MGEAFSPLQAHGIASDIYYPLYKTIKLLADKVDTLEARLVPKMNIIDRKERAMEVTNKMLYAAVRKAVKVGILPAQANMDTHALNHESLKRVIEAAINASDQPEDRVTPNTIGKEV